MSLNDETPIPNRFAAVFREIEELTHENTALELDLLRYLEAELDEIAAHPASLAVVRQLGDKMHLDLTSRAVIERRRTTMEILVGLRGERDKSACLQEPIGSSGTRSLREPNGDGREYARAERRDRRDNDMSNASNAVLSGLVVLVVDDDADTRALLTYVLAEAGAEVVAVESAGQGFELFGRRRFDVLLSDTGLPGQDGWSLVETIRRMSAEEGRGIPAIAITARAYAADIAHSFASGFDAHLSKPVAMPVVIATIARLVGRSAGEAG